MKALFIFGIFVAIELLWVALIYLYARAFGRRLGGNNAPGAADSGRVKEENVPTAWRAVVVLFVIYHYWITIVLALTGKNQLSSRLIYVITPPLYASFVIYAFWRSHRL